MDALLKNFSEFSYEELEKLNLEAKKKRQTRVPEKTLMKEYLELLRQSSGIKAVTICFTNIEGRLHMLDFDKKYFLDSYENLTFDGSSIRGFSSLDKSDLRLKVDWASLRFLPSDVFGAGKVLFFAFVADKDFQPFESDFRYQLYLYTKDLFRKKGIDVYVAPELEGMLLVGEDAEQDYNSREGFQLVTKGGYFHSLPKDQLRLFIDAAAEAQRAMGFENEKDHPEVAPSQFELNFKFGHVLDICDQIQLYKLVCRQIARTQGLTATFLPKPVVGINGNGMHTNISLNKGNQNLFYDKDGEHFMSKMANDFVSRVLNHGQEICLILNSSVNGYRRLDPNFEAPNQIKVSPTDRGSMIRIPIGNERSTRIEVRSVAPDANPYLVNLTILKTGLEGEKLTEPKDRRPRIKYLPGTLHDALRIFKGSTFIETILGKSNKDKYAEFKTLVADRSPKELGTRVKNAEVLYHHEVTNQVIWNNF